jgi:hypothetical protein
MFNMSVSPEQNINTDPLVGALGALSSLECIQTGDIAQVHCTLDACDYDNKALYHFIFSPHDNITGAKDDAILLLRSLLGRFSKSLSWVQIVYNTAAILVCEEYLEETTEPQEAVEPAEALTQFRNALCIGTPVGSSVMKGMLRGILTIGIECNIKTQISGRFYLNLTQKEWSYVMRFWNRCIRSPHSVQEESLQTQALIKGQDEVRQTEGAKSGGF